MNEKEARERVKDLKSFYGHLISYVVFNAGLFATFLIAAGPESLIGPLLVLLGWGGGLSIHAMRVFGIFGLGDPAWEEQKVRELLLTSNTGLSKEDLTQVLHQALTEVAGAGSASDVEERVLQRLEHLETIVTSEDWDLLQQGNDVAEITEEKGIELDTKRDEGSEQQVTRLAKSVR
jgi:2TM domain